MSSIFTFQLGVVCFNQRPAVTPGSNAMLATPDICYSGMSMTPVIFQNFAFASDAANTASSVFISGSPVCHLQSYFCKSCGDEAGTGGGVVSHTILGKAEFVTASSNVFIEGIPAVRIGDLMQSNNRNTVPSHLVGV